MERRTVIVAIVFFCCVMGAGCVHVDYLVKMQHDGSGELHETIRLLPRAVLLMEGRKKRAGAGDTSFDLISDAAIQSRAKDFGGLTVKSKEQKELPDRSRQLKVVYTFQDVNKVSVRMMPTFKGTDPKRDGRLGFRYQRIVYHDWSKKHYKADQMDLRYGRHPTQQKFSSPAVLQEFRRVNPIFLDMIKDFKLTIRIQAPPDVESYEDAGMVVGMPKDGNIVIAYQAFGENVVGSSEVIRSLITGEIGGRSDAWGGSWAKFNEDYDQYSDVRRESA
ncbi:hypothetical protein ACFL01_04780, partial [Planctomycetota bacterium]